MKLLVLSQMYPCLRHPTAAIFFANTLKQLARKVDGVTIVTPRPYIPKVLCWLKPRFRKWHLDPMSTQEGNCTIQRPFYPCLRGFSFDGVNSMLMAWTLRNQVRALCRNRDIDVIVSYNLIPEGVAAVWFARRLGLPVVSWAIGSDVNTIAPSNRLNRSLTKWALQRSSVVLTESLDLAHKVKAIAPAAPARTFYKGIEVSMFRTLAPKQTLRGKLQLEHSRRYLLFVGRVIQRKGVYELATAFSRLASEFPDLDLLLVGEETEKAQVEATTERSQCGQRVKFLGMLPYARIAEYMGASDVLVLPTWAEGLPNVVMEAMAAGLPVVASDVGGIPEVLQDGETGVLVPAQDPDRLKSAIARMLTDPALRERCVRNGRSLIYEAFDVSKNVNELHGILSSLLPINERGNAVAASPTTDRVASISR